MTDEELILEARERLENGAPPAYDSGDVFAIREADEDLMRRLAVRLKALTRPPSEEEVEKMCRAHDEEDAAQRGEPSPWRHTGDDVDFETFRLDRLAAMKAALEVLNARRS